MQHKMQCHRERERNMRKPIYDLNGVRGRRMRLDDRKCVIITDKTVGSFLSGNITDGEKTIFLKDVVGVQFKRSGALIGYLQFETPSMQMNNQKDNMFSENTFTFEDGKNNVTNELMEEVYEYAVNRIEELKYGYSIGMPAPSVSYSDPTPAAEPGTPSAPIVAKKDVLLADDPIDPIQAGNDEIICPICNTRQRAGRKKCWHCNQVFIV